VDERGIATAAGNQVVVCPACDDRAVLEDQDQIGGSVANVPMGTPMTLIHHV
jgi:hypothetical protein